MFHLPGKKVGKNYVIVQIDLMSAVKVEIDTISLTAFFCVNIISTIYFLCTIIWYVLLDTISIFRNCIFKQ